PRATPGLRTASCSTCSWDFVPQGSSGRVSVRSPTHKHRAWETRALWYHLTWALGRLDDPEPRPGVRHWTAPPSSHLWGLLRLFSSFPPAPWAALAPRP